MIEKEINTSSDTLIISNLDVEKIEKINKENDLINVSNFSELEAYKQMAKIKLDYNNQDFTFICDGYQWKSVNQAIHFLLIQPKLLDYYQTDLHHKEKLLEIFNTGKNILLSNDNIDEVLKIQFNYTLPNFANISLDDLKKTNPELISNYINNYSDILLLIFKNIHLKGPHF